MQSVSQNIKKSQLFEHQIFFWPNLITKNSPQHTVPVLDFFSSICIINSKLNLVREIPD